MATKINISIPEPCHENWQNMSVIEKERFCDLCQKKVYDFTYASDREIIAAYNKNNKLCGRFTTSQLNRDLVLPKEKSSIWLATTSAIISFIGLGTHEVFAQEKSATEQTDKKIKVNSNNLVEITGIVTDFNKSPIEGVKISVNEIEKSITDLTGKYSLYVCIGDRISFTKDKFEEDSFKVSGLKSEYNIEMDEISKRVTVLGGAIVGIQIQKKRTFFGRIFHSIEKWFK